MVYSDDQILGHFLQANPTFQRRTNKLLHLITSYDLLEKLVWPLNSYEYNASWLEINYGNNPIWNDEDRDSIEELAAVCQSFWITTIQDDIDDKNLADLTPLFTDSI